METYWLIYRGRGKKLFGNKGVYESNFTKAKPFRTKEAAESWCFKNNCDLVDVLNKSDTEIGNSMINATSYIKERIDLEVRRRIAEILKDI